MANNTITDRIRRGTLLDKQGGAAIAATFAAGPQFIGAAAREWSFWVTVTLGGATAIVLKLQNTYDGTNWATVATFRQDVAQELGEHSFAADGTYLITTRHAVRAYDQAGPDASGNYGGLRLSYRADGVVGANTRVQVVASAW